MPNMSVLARKISEHCTISRAWVERPLLYFMVDLTKVVKIAKFGILSSIFENLCTENEKR